ncbi:MAG: biosynthetic-type acetolactate synthase large subunit [Cellulosilyticaceae bacterium]
MKLSDVFVRCLQEEGVKAVFGYPGAAVIALYESLRTSSIHHVLVRQEQAAVHSASGYARTTGTVGVCMATSGPGATNLITGIATAYMDSIPLVIFTGQVKSNLIGRDVFQEVDITGATEPFVKHSYLLQNPKDFPKIVKEAFYIAKTGRPGPVLIDIPMDFQEEQIDFIDIKDVKIRGYKPTVEGHIGQIKKAVKLLEDSKRPLICVGGGVLLGKAKEEIKQFAEKSHIPVVHTLMGIGALETASPYNFKMVGSHGFKSANWALKHADCIVFVGARIADRAIINPEILDKNTSIIHIDVDPAEIGKITAANIPVVGDAKVILKELTNIIKPIDTVSWQVTIREQKENRVENEYIGCVNPKYVIREISRLASEDAIITADVGQNQMWAARNLEMRANRKFLCSGGLGTMGYSLPSGIGSCIADSTRQVISIMGDGSFQMSFFELGTLVQEGINPIIILFNNSGLGLVREIQRNTTSKEFGVCLNTNPKFTQIAGAYGIPAKTIKENQAVSEALEEAFKNNSPYLLEFIVSERETTL